jgi:hypothetical protein
MMAKSGDRNQWTEVIPQMFVPFRWNFLIVIDAVMMGALG